MTEQEAEDTLLALAHVIEWQDDRRVVQTLHTGYLPDRASGTWYVAYLSDRRKQWRGEFRFDRGYKTKRSPLFYATANEAKAACEKHYTTGKWES